MINVAMKMLGVSNVLSNFKRLKDYSGTGTTQYVVGTNVHYAPYVEFGTSRMRAQPYLRPSAQEVRGRIPWYIGQTSNLDGAIRMAALDLERRAKQKCPVDTGNLRGSIQARKQ